MTSTQTCITPRHGIFGFLTTINVESRRKKKKNHSDIIMYNINKKVNQFEKK